MKKIILNFLLLGFISLNAVAQTPTAQDITDINNKLDNIIKKQESKIFKLGLSIGVRSFFKGEENSRAIAFILPDSTVAIEHGDILAVILSSSLTAFPFGSDYKLWKHVGFTININLLEFTNNKVGTVFNKPIDGGLGFVYSFGEERNFAIAATFERIAVVRPTDYVINQKGQKIIVGGQPLVNLDKTDARYFRDAGLNGWSIKFIYHLN